MKCFEIDISKYLNHKLFVDSFDENNENIGICGMFVSGEEHSYVKTQKISREEIQYTLFGSKNNFDNIIADGQHIFLPKEDNFSHVFFAGFNEFGNYADTYMVKTRSGEEIKYNLFFNAFNQNPENLSDIEISEKCNVLENIVANEYFETHMYFFKEKIANDAHEIILPVNPEMHIFAITLLEE